MNRVLSSLLGAVCGVMLCSIAPITLAQQYPNKPIKMIVPYSPGGLPDTMARIVAQRMTESLGQQVIIENKPGAGGILGTEAVAKSPPDGYTLLVADAAQLVINPALYPKLPYNTLKDLTPISLVGVSPLFVVVHESVAAKNLEELIALAKAKPGTLTYGSSGTGSQHHLTMEALKTPLKLDITHVPYKGTGQSVPAVVAGDVSIAVAALPSLMPHVKSGKVRILAANTKTRSSLAKDIPTIAEITKIEVNYPGEIGILAPAGTPQPIIAKLADAIAKASKHPDTIERFNGLGIEALGTSPDEYMALIKTEIPQYAAVVKAANVKLD
jgi:tripartite-type tricarboxylate transporter receptor subunit TctC